MSHSTLVGEKKFTYLRRETPVENYRNKLPKRIKTNFIYETINVFYYCSDGTVHKIYSDEKNSTT